MPHRYENISKLSTYKVDKELIESIESYYKVQIPQFLGIDQPQLDQVSVTIYSRLGNETYKTISDYKYSLFHNDTKSITVELFLKDRYRGIVFRTRFDKNSEDSLIHICLYDDRGEELLQALKSKLVRTISAKKSMNWMFYPHDFILYPLYLIGFFIGVFGFVSGFKGARPYCIGFVLFLLLYIGTFRFIKGHCTFDSVRQNQVDKIIDWLFLGVAGFVLTCLLTPLGKLLFGN
jgi:hypothetical protein